MHVLAYYIITMRPEWRTNFARKLGAANRLPAQANPLKTYGYQFWLNEFYKKNPSNRKYPDVPADMFYCDGFGFEMIYIIPSKKLVVVRLGLTLQII